MVRRLIHREVVVAKIDVVLGDERLDGVEKGKDVVDHQADEEHVRDPDLALELHILSASSEVDITHFN